MAQPSSRTILLPHESDEYVRVSVAAVAPTRRDIWRILRGTYEPRVRRTERMTVAGMSRAFKEAYDKSDIRELLHSRSPLMDLFR